MSSIPSLSSPLKPVFPPPQPTATSPSDTALEPPQIQSLISTLNLQGHIEGGYFAETDRDPLLIPNPFLPQSTPDAAKEGGDSTRSASTSIFYLLTPKRSLGAFHRNKGRTVHTLHWGRGRYVLLHADSVLSPSDDTLLQDESVKVRVETFVVGKDVERGERLQWVVEGGKYKASFLLGDEEGGEGEGGSERGLLISETVVPGFEFKDHDFLKRERFERLVTKEQAKEMGWLLRSGD